MKQPIQKPTLSVSPENITAAQTKGTASIAVYTAVKWTAVSDQPEWCTVSAASGKGNATLVITYTALTNAARNANILVTPEGGNAVAIEVVQPLK